MDPVSVGANVFTTILIENIDIDPDASVMSIMIRDNGGDPYWVVNGMDVWSGDNDPGLANLLAATRSTETVGGQLTQAAVDAVLPVAREYWMSTGLADWQVAELYRTPVAIGDLSSRGALGVTKPEGIWLDASGAGLGWNTSMLTPNSQLLTSSYDLLTVLTHELGHVLGYGDLDPLRQPDHIMAGVLQPGAGRVEVATSGRATQWVAGAERDSEQWVAGSERDSGSATLLGPAAGRRGPLVDRILDDLLRDDLRFSRDAWQRDEDDEFEPLLARRADEHHEEIDDFFARW
jgi:hypothetical protein